MLFIILTNCFEKLFICYYKIKVHASTVRFINMFRIGFEYFNILIIYKNKTGFCCWGGTIFMGVLSERLGAWGH